ncbi:uncharacterized protein PITG_15551 [Phytophthora infestans T30-4]|uniref:Uncharacterized protein n=1 Tax=Phytophthora infestans (strain T30-4) TaxID=403677 RepID=D0NT22_PHYIT|nr:uncharacterized protein PITG_15551 [Phytophthora infestans T30-4]EEY64778.1 hypothetical protein PITG_15551 [Phytophthora infestans T30-4]|eukprot:XP_002897705.1 hypothetical protein PITG_15551 [Phytophthora infestans T30-4]
MHIIREATGGTPNVTAGTDLASAATLNTAMSSVAACALTKFGCRQEHKQHIKATAVASKPGFEHRRISRIAFS